MRNLKLEQDLVGSDNWPHLAMVVVPADSNAKKLPANLSQVEKEKIIQSWDRVAVLEAQPSISFRVGFMTETQIQWLRVPIQTQNGCFGMRVGAEPAKFFVLPEDLATAMKLRLVAMVKENDSAYAELPLY